LFKPHIAPNFSISELFGYIINLGGYANFSYTSFYFSHISTSAKRLLSKIFYKRKKQTLLY